MSRGSPWQSSRGSRGARGGTGMSSSQGPSRPRGGMVSGGSPPDRGTTLPWPGQASVSQPVPGSMLTGEQAVVPESKPSSRELLESTGGRWPTFAELQAARKGKVSPADNKRPCDPEEEPSSAGKKQKLENGSAFGESPGCSREAAAQNQLPSPESEHKAPSAPPAASLSSDNNLGDDTLMLEDDYEAIESDNDDILVQSHGQPKLTKEERKAKDHEIVEAGQMRATMLRVELEDKPDADDFDRIFLGLIKLYQERSQKENDRENVHPFSVALPPKTGLESMTLDKWLCMRRFNPSSKEKSDSFWYQEDIISNIVRFHSDTHSSKATFCDPTEMIHFLDIDGGFPQTIERLDQLADQVNPSLDWTKRPYNALPRFSASAKYLVVPINTGSHWLTGVIAPDLESAKGNRVGTIDIYNSWPTSSDKGERLLRAFARLISLHPSHSQWKQDSWKCVEKDTTKQVDDVQCGVITAYNCVALMRGNVPVTVAPIHAQHYCNEIRLQQLKELTSNLLHTSSKPAPKPAPKPSSKHAPKPDSKPDLKLGPKPAPKSLAESALHGNGVFTDAAYSLTGSESSGRSANIRAFKVSNSIAKADIDDLFDSALYDEWLPRHGNPDIGIRALLFDAFRGQESDPGQKIGVKTHKDDKSPHFEFAVRDVISLRVGRQLTSTMIEALVSTYCSIDYKVGSKHIARPLDMMEMYAAGPDEVFQGYVTSGRRPFEPKEDVADVYGVANHGGVHYFAFHIDRDEKIVDIADSMRPTTNVGLESIKKRMTTFLDRMSSMENAHESWSSIVGEWEVRWVERVYQQQNGDDCGVHALQNMIDMLGHREMKPFHDADIIRQRLVHRFTHYVDNGVQSWTYVDPLADELHDLWTQQVQPRVAKYDGLVKTIGPRFTSTKDAFDAAARGIKAVHAEPDIKNALWNSFDRIHPASKLSYRQILYCILRDLPGCKGTWDDIFRQYVNCNALLGLPNKSNYKQGLRHALRNKRVGGLMASEDKQTGIITLLPGYKDVDLYGSNSATRWYGAGMRDLYASFADVADDIHTRPGLMFVVSRDSVVKTDKIEDDIMTEQQKTNLRSAAMKSLDTWSTTHQGSPEPMEEITTAEELAQSEASAMYHIYNLGCRSSSSPAFQNNRGIETPQDEIALEILETANDRAEQKGEKLLVTWLVTGVDGWTTDASSILDMVDQYEWLSFRLTMLMPEDKVAELPCVFTARGHNSSAKACQIAWAHFDLNLVAEIYAEVQQDPGCDRQHQRLDQMALLHILREVGDWKEEALAVPSPDDDDSENRADGFPIGNDLTSGLHRHKFVEGPEKDKACVACSSLITETAWHRFVGGGADVVCDDCIDVDEALSVPETDCESRTSIRWTDEEDDILREGKRRGLTMEKIAECVEGRSYGACTTRWYRLEEKGLWRKRG